MNTTEIQLTVATSPAWVDTVLGDFNAFLQDHADCERKASAMALSFVAKYPDRKAIIPGLIATALEELRHFQQVYRIMEKRGVPLTHELTQDPYIRQLLSLCRTGRDERLLDRLLIAAVVECRGAERFRLVADALQDARLKDFYRRLYESEVNHGNVYLEMARCYFEEQQIHQRVHELVAQEGIILDALPLRPALH
ncbi:MAG: hydroxylase [Chitinophagales bacterium]|nr:MAG: hydroxylase [Chitinophagales bacterium]